MTTKQPEALRLADVIDSNDGNFHYEESSKFDSKLSEACYGAAAELRRLHEVNAELLAALREAERLCPVNSHAEIIARAAIFKATGEA